MPSLAMLALKPIRKISPSRYMAFKRCKLREVLNCSGSVPLLPKGPAAYLGIIIHSFLEKAANLNAGDLIKLWDQCEKQQEGVLVNSQMEQHYVPLKKNIRFYELRKKQAFKLAGRMAKDPDINEARGKSVACATEVLITDNDQWIGKIDKVVTTDQGDILIDYKSGSITEEDDDLVVKEEYQIQLKLYAGLYHRKYGRYPSKLYVIDMSGNYHEIAFRQDECSDLMEEAETLLKETNALIVATPENYDQLACPSEENCRFCAFRPACRPYLEKNVLDTTNPFNDLKGKLTEKRMLGNGLTFVKLNTESGGEIFVRGIHIDRHPVIKKSLIGDDLLLFSLTKESAISYAENIRSAAYLSNGHFL